MLCYIFGSKKGFQDREVSFKWHTYSQAFGVIFLSNGLQQCLPLKF